MAVINQGKVVFFSSWNLLHMMFLGIVISEMKVTLKLGISAAGAIHVDGLRSSLLPESHSEILSL